MDGISPAAETTADAHYDYIAGTLYCLTYLVIRCGGGGYTLKRPLWGESFGSGGLMKNTLHGNVHRTLPFMRKKLARHLCY